MVVVVVTLVVEDRNYITDFGCRWVVVQSLECYPIVVVWRAWMKLSGGPLHKVEVDELVHKVEVDELVQVEQRSPEKGLGVVDPTH